MFDQFHSAQHQRVGAPIDVFGTDLAEYERRKNTIGSISYWPAREAK
jgi:hypothetical protein